MNLLLMILAAVVVAFLLAFVIVKFVPLKLRGLISVLLLIAAGFLAYLIYQGIMEPIKFAKEKKVRYAKVIDNLKLIRDAQINFKEGKYRYSKNKAELLKFIETDSLPIIETYSKDTVINVGGGITKNTSIKKTRVTGYDQVIDKFKGTNYKEMFKVPGTDKEFTLENGVIEKVAGLMVPVFKAKVDKASILKGMNESLVKQELEAKESDQIKGEFVSVGSLEEVSTGGNWPPSYDALDIESKE